MPPSRPPAALHGYLTRHAQVALASLGRLTREPLASLMTLAVIAIALALPTTLYLLTDNLQRLGTVWDGDTTISLFLTRASTLQAAEELTGQLQQWQEIDTAQLITPEQALQEFRALSGFGDALDLLQENPLPAVIAVKPSRSASDEARLAGLLDRLKALPAVELAQLDLLWVKRLNAILALARQAIRLIATLLGLAVLLIIGNTIRLEIQNRRDEIEIIQLIGATHRFIRRPFLYTGLWYGLLGAALAWLLVQSTLLLMDRPVSQLAGLYDSHYRLMALSVSDSLLLLVTGAVLGLLGAWLAVGRHLRSLEPDQAADTTAAGAARGRRP